MENASFNDEEEELGETSSIPQEGLPVWGLMETVTLHLSSSPL